MHVRMYREKNGDGRRLDANQCGRSCVCMRKELQYLQASQWPCVDQLWPWRNHLHHAAMADQRGFEWEKGRKKKKRNKNEKLILAEETSSESDQAQRDIVASDRSLVGRLNTENTCDMTFEFTLCDEAWHTVTLSKRWSIDHSQRLTWPNRFLDFIPVSNGRIDESWCRHPGSDVSSAIQWQYGRKTHSHTHTQINPTIHCWTLSPRARFLQTAFVSTDRVRARHRKNGVFGVDVCSGSDVSTTRVEICQESVPSSTTRSDIWTASTTAKRTYPIISEKCAALPPDAPRLGVGSGQTPTMSTSKRQNDLTLALCLWLQSWGTTARHLSTPIHPLRFNPGENNCLRM